ARVRGRIIVMAPIASDPWYVDHWTMCGGAKPEVEIRNPAKAENTLRATWSAGKNEGKSTASKVRP
ncbi:MAG: hypothetical protein KDK08_13585, partial [Rhizobiaceae bacterium]|nr:hypothetical protein [Rhizobiaceae bacterium]